MVGRSTKGAVTAIPGVHPGQRILIYEMAGNVVPTGKADPAIDFDSETKSENVRTTNSSMVGVSPGKTPIQKT